MEVKEEGEKVGLKLNIQKTKIIASGPITSWQIVGETMRNFIFWSSQITADGDCSHEIKRCLSLNVKLPHFEFLMIVVQPAKGGVTALVGVINCD